MRVRDGICLRCFFKLTGLLYCQEVCCRPRIGHPEVIVLVVVSVASMTSQLG